jgi:hypothetical protein
MTHVERLQKMIAMWHREPRDMDLAGVMLGYAMTYPEAVAELMSMPVEAVPGWLTRMCVEAVTAAREPADDAAIVRRGAAAFVHAVEAARAVGGK